MDGKAYCHEDYAKSGLMNCKRCHNSIVGLNIKACEGAFHPQCFTCTTCNSSFQGRYFVHESKPFCLYHYHEATNTICRACRNPITGSNVWFDTDQCVQFGGSQARFHKACWVCDGCGVELQLAGLPPFHPKGGKYCAAHFNLVWSPIETLYIHALFILLTHGEYPDQKVHYIMITRMIFFLLFHEVGDRLELGFTLKTNLCF